MARLGELLVAAGMLTPEQVEQALRAQVMWGGRLGTNLVELGYIDLDKLANALGKQHRLPAALGKHFERGDPAIQKKLSMDLAEKFSCVPIMRAGPSRSLLIVASIAPIEARGVAMIADDLEVDPKAITQSVAGELRIRYHLERIYNIPRSTRYLRSRGKTIPPFPQFDIDPLAFEDSQVDQPTIPVAVVPPAEEESAPIAVRDSSSEEHDLAIEETRRELRARLETKAAEKAKTETLQSTERTMSMKPQRLPTSDEDIQELEALANLEETAVPETVERDDSTGRERRRYVQTLDASPPAGTERPLSQPSLARISIRRMQLAAAEEAEATSTGSTLGEATRAIRRSIDRDRVAELVSETLFRFMLSCDAAQMLVIRGDAAIGWKGFSRSGGSVPEIAVPLDQPGLIPRVIESCRTLRLPAHDLVPIDQLLLVSLGAKTGDLVIVPVSIANQVMCVIAMATQRDAVHATAESIAAAAGAAFARLMRNASR